MAYLWNGGGEERDRERNEVSGVINLCPLRAHSDLDLAVLITLPSSHAVILRPVILRMLRPQATWSTLSMAGSECRR